MSTTRRTLTATLALVALVTVGALSPGRPAAAQDGPGGSSGNGSFGFSDEQGVPLGAEPPTGSSSSGGPPATYNVEFFEGLAPEEGTFEDESGCWGATLAEGTGGSTWAEVQATLTEYNDAQAYGVCAEEETFDLAGYVLLAWQTSVRPPPPTPLRIAPGKALVGLPAYLEIGGDPNPTQTLDNPIGPDIVVTMTPRYVVRWGDGSSTPTTSQGGPYPDGSLTHTYLEVGGVTVTVDAYWHATWTAGGFGGALPELPDPTSESLDLPVEQRQAVIDPE